MTSVKWSKLTSCETTPRRLVTPNRRGASAPFKNFKFLNFHVLSGNSMAVFFFTDVMVTTQRRFLDNRHHGCSFIYKNVTAF